MELIDTSGLITAGDINDTSDSFTSGPATTNTGGATNVWDVIGNALNSGFGLYKEGVDAKVNAVQTELSWPKMALDAGIVITISVLVYKLLAGGKRKVV